jgi:hypothetical protein
MEIIHIHKQINNINYKNNKNKYSRNIRYIYYPIFFNESFFALLHNTPKKALPNGIETIEKCFNGEIFDIEYRFLSYKIDSFRNVSDVYLLKTVSEIKNKIIKYNEIFKQ